MHTDTPGLADPSRPGTAGEGEGEAGQGRVARGIARGALIVASLTAFSRVLGLVRTVVFSQTVGSGCLGTAYTTANQVPNLIVELAIGGALSSAMVPVLARAASRAQADPGARVHVERVASALMTWSVIILLPVTAAVALAATQISQLLNPVNPNAACNHGDMISVTSFLLVSFAPQVVLYGLSVVLGGLLQAYRKFSAVSLAPVLGNVVTITAFLVFGSIDHSAPLASTPEGAELVLAIGTTMNIGMMVIVTLPSVWRLRLRWRPTLRFPPGVFGRAGGLALVGLLEFVAADIYSVVTIDLANGHGQTGALVLVNYSNLVFAAMCSVLPLAIITSTFPVLAASEGDAFDRTSAGSTRAVVLMCWLSTAVMIAVAIPAAHVLVHSQSQIPQLTEGFLLFAPGVSGYGLITNLSRVLFALGKLRVAGVFLVAQQLLPAVLSFPLVLLGPPRFTVAALALASSVGMLALNIPMVAAARRLRGPAAVEGVGRAELAGIAAAAAGAAAGLVLNLVVPRGGSLYEGGTAVVAAVLAVAVFGAVAYALDRDDMRAAAGRVRRHLRSR